jgi:putative acetyltransferase
VPGEVLLSRSPLKGSIVGRQATIPMRYPRVVDKAKVGSYPASAGAGGGYVWDAVLEYRVWCYPAEGAADLDDGSDYYYAFATFAEASKFASKTKGAQEPLALILQEEYIEEPVEGEYIHVKERRVTEWPVEFLSRPKRNRRTIPDFLSSNAPANRLDIIRGKANGS